MASEGEILPAFRRVKALKSAMRAHRKCDIVEMEVE